MLEQIKNGIKAARLKKEYSEIELAHKINIEVSVLKSWELGAITPTVENIKQLAIILDSSTDELLFSEKRISLSLKDLSIEEKELIRKVYDSIKL